MKNILSKIDTLYQEYNALKPLQKKEEARLWEKFRLEWNYNSNHIEGNTLTYGDTQLLLRLGDDFKAQHNSLRDVEEMRAHDVAIFTIKEWAADTDRPLLEGDIRDLNKLILVRPFWADAKTPDGQATRRRITPGKYKEQPNHVERKEGDIFRYAEPHEVVPKMQELLDWYSNQNAEHPLVTAAFFHYKFVLIHPFDDGNGRVSRLLMNFHLMKHGYPPIIIKSADKKNYLYALQQADAGNVQAFIQYIAEQLIWSLEFAVKAAKGEAIEERDDLYKEIEVWKKEVQGEWTNELKRSDKLVMKIYEDFIDKIVKLIESKIVIFDELFLKKRTSLDYDFSSRGGFTTVNANFLEQFKEAETTEIQGIRLTVAFDTPYDTNGKLSSTKAYLHFYFELYGFSINIDHTKTLKKDYHQQIKEDEMNMIADEFIKSLYKRIKR